MSMSKNSTAVEENISPAHESTISSSSKSEWINNFEEFCNHTTFHGLKFVGNSKISFAERMLFGTAFIIYFITASFFIYNAYRKWCENPVYIGINPKATFISDIPFPAVTICNMNRAMLSKIKDFQIESEEYDLLQTICGKKSYNSTEMQNTNFNQSSKYTWFEDFVTLIAQPCEKMILQCSYGSINRNCSQIFQTVLTDVGLCCTFNAVHFSFIAYDYDENNIMQEYDYAVPWNAEHGYPTDLKNLSYYPRPAYGTGVSMGLRLILDADFDEYYCSSTNGAGFKINIHNPIEYPIIKETGDDIEVGTEARIRIRPELRMTSESFRKIDLKYRNCVFLHEKNLTTFKLYSKHNCEQECEAQHIIDICNCTLYYQPPVANVSICSPQNRRCVEHTTFLSRQEFIENMGCKENCPQSCFDLKYYSDVFSTSIKVGNYRIKDDILKTIPKDYVEKSITILNLFYKDNAFYGQVKDEFTGMTDFFASTGGLMGLFLGFSCISIVEIIYYCTLRPICIKRRVNKEN